MSIDVKLFTTSSTCTDSRNFDASFKGYISFPVIEAGGYSTLSSILDSCDIKIPCGDSTNPELEEYDSYFIKKQEFESMKLPSYIFDQYFNLMNNSHDNYNYLIFQPF